MFSNIESLVSFSYIWYACVMARCMMMVWLRVLLGRCAWRRFHRIMMEGFVVEKISSASFLFCEQRKKLWERGF